MCFQRRPQKLKKSSPWIWHLLHNVKLTVKISSIFVAFLENMNFNLTSFFAPKRFFLKLVKTQGCLFLAAHKRKSWMRTIYFCKKNRENADFEIIQPSTQYSEQVNLTRFFSYVEHYWNFNFLYLILFYFLFLGHCQPRQNFKNYHDTQARNCQLAIWAHGVQTR